MIKSTGHADLPLHTGTVPKWLADRMMQLGTLIVESLVLNYGRQEVLTRLSDPLWFQSLGCVLGMDWHSSGITTSVMYALKRGLNARANAIGIYICGGRGKYSGALQKNKQPSLPTTAWMPNHSSHPQNYAQKSTTLPFRTVFSFISIISYSQKKAIGLLFSKA